MAETGNYAALQSLYRGVSPYALAGLSTVPNYGAAAANGQLFVSGTGSAISATNSVSGPPNTLTAALQNSTSSSSTDMPMSPALEMYYRQVQAMASLQKHQPQENSCPLVPIPPTTLTLLSTSAVLTDSSIAPVTTHEPLSSSTKESLVQPVLHQSSNSKTLDDACRPQRSSSTSPIAIATSAIDNKQQDEFHASSEANSGKNVEMRRSNQPIKPTPIVVPNIDSL